MAHNAKQNGSDNLPSYSPDNHLGHMLSVGVLRGSLYVPLTILLNIFLHVVFGLYLDICCIHSVAVIIRHVVCCVIEHCLLSCLCSRPK